MNDLIRTTAELEAACARARETGVLSLDTEFVWMRTYRPQLGIVQIGSDAENCHALDCMTGMKTDALKELIEEDLGVIANRATVIAFVDDVNDETNPLAIGWRYEVIGREMAEKFGVE